MHWEIWDTESGNLVGEYATEEAALSIVREAVRRHGAAVANMLALGAEHDDEGVADEELPAVLRGAELVARAQAGVSEDAADLR